MLNAKGFVRAVVSQARKKHSTSQERYLKRLYVEIYVVPMPCPSPNDIRHDRAKQSVEVEQEEYGEDCGNDQKDQEFEVEAWRHLGLCICVGYAQQPVHLDESFAIELPHAQQRPDIIVRSRSSPIVGDYRKRGRSILLCKSLKLQRPEEV